ncbi:MAG: PHP domain-containing protein [Christensenella sp.]|nr:PHP domain-containing protein [Christensenella sp.]
MKQAEQTTKSQTPFDLHLHSNCSDGFDAPARVVEQANECGVTLLALTDHDSICGVPEAMQAGERLGVRVLPAIEMDTDWPHELHILGLDIDIFEPGLVRALEQARTRRGLRNNEIAERLKRAGYDILPFLNGGTEVATRLNIAIALVEGGFAESTRDAFIRFLRKGCPGYFAVERFTPEEVISLIRGAGGIPVWAHPMHGHPDVHALTDQLKSLGLMGLEAYHPSMSEGEADVLVSIARQKKLLVTCGSDYHGANRPGVVPGQTWREHPVLRECRAALEARPARVLPMGESAKTN